MNRLVALAMATAVTASSAAMADGGTPDFGKQVEFLARLQALPLFGVFAPIGASSTVSLTADQANANPAGLITVARGLRANVVSAAATLGPNIDQMALLPSSTNPTHIIACNEQGTTAGAVQRIEIKTGRVENVIVGGMASCDPVRLTPWGTVVVGEENGSNGRIFEVFDPLHTSNVTVPSSGFGPSSDPTHVAGRPALGQFSFEGFGLLPNGIVYYTDENRPGNGGIGNPGGAFVKFIPSALSTGGSIPSLDQSPWTSGSLYGMRLGRNSGNTDVGQGNQIGRGVWLEITGTAPINLRAAASALKLTSFYRPEDATLDQNALADGRVRVCGTNTGQDIPDTVSNGGNNWGEVYCLTDGTVSEASSISVTNGVNTASIPEFHPLVVGYRDFAMPDNIEIQPGRGNFLINEDGEGPTYSPPRNNDIWDCLDDGDDADSLADACIKVMTLNDLLAESTGGIFDASGRHYYVSIQHNVTGHGVILDVTGWR